MKTVFEEIAERVAVVGAPVGYRRDGSPIWPVAGASFSNYLEQKLLDHAFGGTTYTQPTNVYCSLHTADPGETGASEATGGSYARQVCSMAAAATPGGTKSTNADLAFTNMPASTITHVGVWDAVTTGNFMVGGALAASKTLNAGDTFRITSGNLTISLD